VQAIDESDERRRLEDAGWVAARPGDSRVTFRLGGVAMARRALRSRLPAAPPPVALSASPDAAWLENDERALAHQDAALAVLQGPEDVVFGAVTDNAGEVVAKGRAALSIRSDVWVALTDLWVSADHRRRGLGSVVLRELLGWAAERGAGTACLQVRPDNVAAAGLYDGLGLSTHHTYRYLTPSEALPQRSER
jgi:ribosomal protein S18 acetylase RimI-like enzyme